MDASPSSDTQTPAPATSTTTVAVSPITTASLFSELPPLAPLSPPSPVVVPPAAAHNTNRSDNDSAASEQQEQKSQATAYQRKRAERMFSCENMKDLDRDLRITGATKKGSSWQYHIEVLDTRVRMPSFTDPGCLASSAVSPTSGEKATAATPRDGAADPVEGDASYAQLPPMVRYSVMRRYNDFRQLVIYLSDTYGPELLETLPKFPESGIMSYIRGDDPRLLKYRKEQLQKFLRALDEHPHLKWCKGLTHFLRPDILELTTIGGMFQMNADTSSEYLGGSGGGFVPQPPTSSSGYVSLSLVKSPEIRFSKQLTSTDGRGDWKRRRVPFPIWGSSNDSEIDAGVIVKKRVSLTEEEDDDDDEGDSDSEENIAQGNRNTAEKSEERVRNRGSNRQEQEEEDRTLGQQKKATQLMKLLSLEPSTTAQ